MEICVGCGKPAYRGSSKHPYCKDCWNRTWKGKEEEYFDWLDSHDLKDPKDSRLKIDLGCGTERINGFVGVDRNPDVRPDFIADIEKGLPFKDSTVDVVRAYHFLEHVSDIFVAMKEIYRVCKNGAEVEILVPHWKNEGAFSSPDHVRVFTPSTMGYFDKMAKTWERARPPINVDFRVKNVKVIRGRIKFWKPYCIKYVLKAVKYG